MDLKVLNSEGEEVGRKAVLATWEHRPVKAALLHQAVVTAHANARIPWAHAKGRGEVRGGGRKPWRQKGTGRARHGSIRSPLWKGGGVTHGPLKMRTYTRRFPAAMRRSALGMTLVVKVRDAECVCVEHLPTFTKTKEFVTFLGRLNLSGSVLVSPPSGQTKDIRKVSRNIKNITVKDPAFLAAADILNVHTLLVTSESWQTLEQRVTPQPQTSGEVRVS